MNRVKAPTSALPGLVNARTYRETHAWIAGVSLPAFVSSGQSLPVSRRAMLVWSPTDTLRPTDSGIDANAVTSRSSRRYGFGYCDSPPILSFHVLQPAAGVRGGSWTLSLIRLRSSHEGYARMTSAVPISCRKSLYSPPCFRPSRCHATVLLNVGRGTGRSGEPMVRHGGQREHWSDIWGQSLAAFTFHSGLIWRGNGWVPISRSVRLYSRWPTLCGSPRKSSHTRMGAEPLELRKGYHAQDGCHWDIEEARPVASMMTLRHPEDAQRRAGRERPF
ncbi:hypothetical protein C8Q76DRAFT_117119 [Earliella scabrosa]|nr:hypothetical protein C8Q76DRAFT_117119 [Earliella scabrosa]